MSGGTRERKQRGGNHRDHPIVVLIVIVLVVVVVVVLGLPLKEAIDDDDNEKTGRSALPPLARGIAPAGTKRFRASAFGIKFLADHAADVVRQ